MKKKIKKFYNKKLLGIVVAIVLVVAGFFVAHNYFWVFTPAFSQRQTAQRFLKDLSKNDVTAAYSLTSSDFQSTISYNTFLTQSQNIAGHSFSVQYNNYITAKDAVAMDGYINDKTFGQKLSFVIKTVDSPAGQKVDAADFDAVN